jgi:hypothetical protein
VFALMMMSALTFPHVFFLLFRCRTAPVASLVIVLVVLLALDADGAGAARAAAVGAALARRRP